MSLVEAGARFSRNHRGKRSGGPFGRLMALAAACGSRSSQCLAYPSSLSPFTSLSLSHSLVMTDRKRRSGGEASGREERVIRVDLGSEIMCPECEESLFRSRRATGDERRTTTCDNKEPADLTLLSCLLSHGRRMERRAMLSTDARRIARRNHGKRLTRHQRQELDQRWMETSVMA